MKYTSTYANEPSFNPSPFAGGIPRIMGRFGAQLRLVNIPTCRAALQRHSAALSICLQGGD